MAYGALEQGWVIPAAGETVAGKYLVEGQCGQGGLSVVLSAMHVELDRRVAIKMLLPEWARDQEVVQRFLREGRAATRIRSEHVVRVFDVGTHDAGAPFLVLEYLEGNNLDEVLARWGPLPVATAIDWVLQAAEAIGEAHSYGIVHRDLKPGNLFLTTLADGSACIKVIDFGLSKVTDPRMSGACKLTRPTDVMGSPHYMAPEQLRATCDADARADIWALGAVLHELLSGRPPFGGESMPQICATVLTQPPPRLSSIREDVPREVEDAVLRCLEKDADRRFPKVAELARAIAPFGTDGARASCARIERITDAGLRASVPTPVSQWMSLPAPPVVWPSGPRHEAHRMGAASWRIVAGASLILAGVGVGAFLWMYESVHGRHVLPPQVGIAELQGTAAVIAPTKLAPMPAGVQKASGAFSSLPSDDSATEQPRTATALAVSPSSRVAQAPPRSAERTASNPAAVPSVRAARAPSAIRGGRSIAPAAAAPSRLRDAAPASVEDAHAAEDDPFEGRK